MRHFAVKVELLASGGDHIRWLPAALASAMVAGGAAVIHNQNGSVKSIMLTASAATHARLIGPPSEPGFGVRFTRREMLDESGTRIWGHHRRATDYA